MSVIADYWPYVILIAAGFLPNEVWRWLGIAASGGISEDSELLVWVRCVATAILAGVVGKLVIFAPGALASVPMTGRLGAVAVALGCYFVFGRSIFAGVTAGALALVLFALILAG